MTANDFMNKWKDEKDPDGTPMVGIVVHWEKISPQSRVVQLLGQEAWQRMLEYAPPWHNAGVVKPFKQWIGSEAYMEEIERERQAGKLEYYENNGLEYPFFCVFATGDGLRGVVGDGNHRFLNCEFLEGQGKDFSQDIARCTLDVLYLPNLSEVIQDRVFPDY